MGLVHEARNQRGGIGVGVDDGGDEDPGGATLPSQLTAQLVEHPLQQARPHQRHTIVITDVEGPADAGAAVEHQPFHREASDVDHAGGVDAKTRAGQTALSG